MKYYLAINKNKMLAFATAWMDLEDIMLSEIRQGKIYTVLFHLCVKSKEQHK